MNKRVLIITYYWPPAGGAGVQRWLKFVKYLPEYGWDPVVYTAENGEFPVLDYSLEKEVPDAVQVIRRKIREPYNWYKKFIGQKPEEKINAGFLSEQEKPAKKENLAKWIRGNLFIPDARKFWIRPSVKFLTAYLRKNPVDIIISTGPPHSMHLIALGVKNRLNLRWIADFRDPWTKIDFYEELHLTKRANRRHHKLEKKVIQSADLVLTVTRQMKKEFDMLGPEQCIYLPNGFDPADFPQTMTLPDKKFRIVYMGSLNKTRNSGIFWKVVSKLARQNPSFAGDLKIEIVGKTDISVRKTISRYDLNVYVQIEDYLPHNEVSVIQKKAALLLLLINRTPDARGIVTGKIFEYLASRRPILAIGPPDGEAALILRETKSGKTVNFDDEKTLEITLIDYYNAFISGNLIVQPGNVERFSRKNLTGELAGFCEKILS